MADTQVPIKGLSKNYNIHEQETGAGPEEDQIWHLQLYNNLNVLKLTSVSYLKGS